jgi:hypothetical protein
MKSAVGAPITVEKYRRWIGWLTTAESLLVPAVPAALIWAITADQQVREMELNPFQVAWSDYGAGDWLALAVAGGVWAALIIAFGVRRCLMGKLVAIIEGHRMEKAVRIATGDSSERRERMARHVTLALPVLWFVSVVALPVPAVWQVASLAAGTWLAWEWRAVEKVEASRTETLHKYAAEAAEEAQEREMFGD